MAEARSGSVQGDLFGRQRDLPDGLVYEPGFLAPQEEASLLRTIQALPLEEAKYKEYTAKRRALSYGSQYDFSANELHQAPAIPTFLQPLQEKCAQWLGSSAEQFVHALVSEYRPGTALGWHRDVPHFELIVGVSLGGAATMRLRPYRPGGKNARQDVITLALEQRSVYVLRGNARWGWQHSIAATKGLRYSITLRTARRANA